MKASSQVSRQKAWNNGISSPLWRVHTVFPAYLPEMQEIFSNKPVRAGTVRGIIIID
jgi:hypothetical protein